MVRNSKGETNVLILILIVLFFIFFGKTLLNPRTPSRPVESGTPIETVSGQCCDKGNGDQCKPYEEDDKTFTLARNGRKYGLIKSNTTLTEKNAHLLDSGETFKGDPVILNVSDEFAQDPNVLSSPECGRAEHKDQIWGPPSMGSDGQRCVPIENDSIVLVCKEKCSPVDRSYRLCQYPFVSCYGQQDAVYDVYYDLSVYQSQGVPDIVKNCEQEQTADGAPPATKKMVVYPSDYPGKPNLQLKNFKIITYELQQGAAGWFSPWCKPAIYLYPEQPTDINVKVNSNFPLTFTFPRYPLTGWNVTAYPDGQLLYQNTFYDYLYYESQIPDDLIKQPNEGFVVEYTHLREKLSEILPKLGLNEKESRQFKEYWLNALPNSKYYFIGILPEENINIWAPLEITPSPKNSIRVTIYFKALEDEFINSYKEPIIQTPSRDGYTLLEWGGVFKGKPGESFSCLM